MGDSGAAAVVVVERPRRGSAVIAFPEPQQMEWIGKAKDLFWWDKWMRRRRQVISLARTPLMQQIVIAARADCDTRGLLYEIANGIIPEHLTKEGVPQWLCVVCLSSAAPLLLSSVALYKEQLAEEDERGIADHIAHPALFGEVLYVVPRALQRKYGLKVVFPLGGIGR